MRVRTSGQLVSPLGNSVSPIDTAAEQAHTPRRASAELQTLAEPGTVDHEDSPTSSPHGLFVRFGSGLQAGPGAGEEPRVAPSASRPPTGAPRARRVRRRQRLRAPAAGVRESARKRLDRLRRKAVAAGVRASALLRDSASAPEEIVRVARAKRIDIIVMGTHGRGGIAKMFLGSVAERVVRTATRPVLTVRGR